MQPVGATLRLLTGHSALWSGARLAPIGCADAAATYGIGRLFGVAVGQEVEILAVDSAGRSSAGRGDPEQGRSHVPGARYTWGVDREALIVRLRMALESSGAELVFAYLFGSFARGDQKETSDVDLAVYYREPPRTSLDSLPACLEADLVRELGREVQVIDLHRAPPDLVFRILRDKVVLLDREKPRRIRFEVRARNEFWDLEPILDIVRKKRRTSA